MFIVEGIKMVKEALLSGWEVEGVLIEDGKINIINNWDFFSDSIPVYHCESSVFRTFSAQVNPEGILAVVNYPSNQPYFGQFEAGFPSCLIGQGPGFILDNIQDPGNVGTILRIADWFGIRSAICIEGTADILNPKTLRSSMGAIFRVKINYVRSLIPEILNPELPLVAADMSGENLASAIFSGKEWIILGNEANGISEEIKDLPHVRRIRIEGRGMAESLNVGVAAGIFAYELFRNESMG